jgi:hypothetical protein
MNFVEVPCNAGTYLEIYNRIAVLADDYTGIPAYTYGTGNVGSGITRTKGGLEMLMQSSARGIKRVIYRVHADIIATTINRLVEWHMIYDDDEAIKGDVEVRAVGITALIAKEQLASRRQEFLNNTVNPIDSQIIGPERRAIILREQAKGLELPGEDIVPSKEEITAKIKAMLAAAQQGQPGGSPQASSQAA